MAAHPKPPPSPVSASSLPKTQGSPADKPATWINQRELGRLFGLNVAQMGKLLTDLGWRNKSAPSEQCLASGLAKEVSRLAYRHRDEASMPPLVSYRWHRQKATEAITQACGLEPLSEREVFARAIADQLVTGFKPMLKQARRAARAGAAFDWGDTLRSRDWFTQRLERDIKSLPEQEIPDFLVILNGMLVDRGVPQNGINALLDKVGFLQLLRAHLLDQRLDAAGPTPKNRPRL